MEQVVEADPLAARRAERARKARLNYEENKEAERKRRKDGMARARANGGPKTSKYDVDDYAQEWEELTYLGLDAARIISGSIPSERWFLTWVMPRVSASRCSSCGRVFNPAETGTFLVCSKTCELGSNNEWGRHAAG